MNSLLTLLGVESWKPVLTALALPPVPLLLLMLLGARLILSRRGLGWLLVLLGAVGIWLSACTGVSEWLSRAVLHPPPALSKDAIARLKTEAKAQPGVTILVLGGGVDAQAPEYGGASLSRLSLERLRYGVWLARETGAPLAFTGGTGWASEGGTSEAEVAERIAAREFGLPLKWIETQSRDTRQNAIRSVALLRKSGTTRAVLVTHGWHMPRALRLFDEAAAGTVEFVPASMGMADSSELPALDWIPSARGSEGGRHVLREMLGRVAGA